MTTEYYYDDRGALILLSCEDGTGLYFYPEADGSIGSIGINGNRYYYVRNAQNDIIGITDKTGAFVARYTYDEWGVITSVTDGNGVDVSSNPNHIEVIMCTFAKIVFLEMSRKGIISCPHSQKQLSFSFLGISVNDSGDILIGTSGSFHAILGGHASFYFNYSEFIRRLYD